MSEVVTYDGHYWLPSLLKRALQWCRHTTVAAFARSQSNAHLLVMDADCQQASELERRYVRHVYDKIAPHFCDSRYKAWPKVKHFLNGLPKNSVVADIGCGNGKYSAVDERLFFVGCDVCSDLASLAREQAHKSDILLADNLALPYRDDSFDAIISIAVIHHFSTESRRLKAIREMARCVRPGSPLMIYVWAMEQDQRQFCAQDVLVPWHLHEQLPTKGESTSETAADAPQPVVRFHMNSTKEQRIIQGSVGIEPPQDTPKTWTQSFTTKLDRLWSSVSPKLPRHAPTAAEHDGIDRRPLDEIQPPTIVPPAIPEAFLDKDKGRSPSKYLSTDTLVSGLFRLSPSLGRKVSNYFRTPEQEIDQLATNFATQVIQQAIEEVMRIRKRDSLTFYRYYHVFKKAAGAAAVDGMTNQVETERQRTPPADCDDEQYEELEEEEATHDSDENERVVQVGDGLNNQNVVYQARPSCLICDQDEDEEGPATEAEKASNVHVSYEVGGEAVVESSGRPPMRLRPLTQQERWTMAALRWKKQKQLMAEIKRREESKMAAAASSANAGEGASKAQQADDGAVDATNLNLLSRAAAHRDRRYAVKVMRRCGSQIAKPKCYICKMILGGAKQLAEHLLAHVQTRYQCRKCGKMDGADNGLQLRRLKLCRTCFRTAKLDHHDPLIVVD
uniref:Methyltransferase type 11 domain-containing protein n=1 Tax=Plectus sambesii TaxID=2011161 RepID=A0A914XNG2_9BILA